MTGWVGELPRVHPWREAEEPATGAAHQQGGHPAVLQRLRAGLLLPSVRRIPAAVWVSSALCQQSAGPRFCNLSAVVVMSTYFVLLCEPHFLSLDRGIWNKLPVFSSLCRQMLIVFSLFVQCGDNLHPSFVRFLSLPVCKLGIEDQLFVSVFGGCWTECSSSVCFCCHTQSFGAFCESFFLSLDWMWTVTCLFLSLLEDVQNNSHWTAHTLSRHTNAYIWHAQWSPAMRRMCNCTSVIFLMLLYPLFMLFLHFCYFIPWFCCLLLHVGHCKQM